MSRTARNCVLSLVLLGCCCGNSSCDPAPLRGTAAPASVRAAPGERVPVRISIPPDRETQYTEWEVRPASLGSVWYLATSPEDLKYRPELPTDPSCGPDKGRPCGRIAVFIPVREGEGEIRVTALTRPGLLKATPVTHVIATVPFIVRAAQGKGAGKLVHTLLYRRKGSWFFRSEDRERPLSGDFHLAILSPGGRWIAAAATAPEGGLVRVLERESGVENLQIKVRAHVDHLAWSSSGATLAVISGGQLWLLDPRDVSSARRVWLPGNPRPYSLHWAGLSTRLDFHTLTSVWHAFESHLADAAEQDVKAYLGPGELLTSADVIAPNPRDETSFVFTRPVPRKGKPDTRHALFMRYDGQIREIGDPDGSYLGAVWAPDGPWIYANKIDPRAAGGQRLMRFQVPDGAWVEVAEWAERVSVGAPCDIPESGGWK